MRLRVRPLTPDLWPAFEDLFGPKGACAGCWCMYWRVGAEYRRRPAAANKADFKRLVLDGGVPGLLAFEDERAVGWCQITPRSALPWLERTPRLARIDATPVWSLSCFYIRIGCRRRGVTSALVGAAITMARRAGAPALEAYPLDAALTPSASGTGYLSTFTRAGFKVVARHAAPRPIVRYTFGAPCKHGRGKQVASRARRLRD
jgi:hypothetical protein